MEPDVTLSMIRIAVVPIGEVPSALLPGYHTMLLRHHMISSFYTRNLRSRTNRGIAPFQVYTRGTPPSPWESNRKILAVISICHCPSWPDLDSVVENFNATCKSYDSSLVQRCFAFCPGDSQNSTPVLKLGLSVLFLLLSTVLIWLMLAQFHPVQASMI